MAGHDARPHPQLLRVDDDPYPHEGRSERLVRIGADGEPELLLHDDLRGYSWIVPKTDWLNVGCGTVDPTEVRAASSSRPSRS